MIYVIQSKIDNSLALLTLLQGKFKNQCVGLYKKTGYK